MNIDEILLRELLKSGPRRAGIPFNLVFLPALVLYKERSIKNRILYLKKKHYITFEGRHMMVTNKGKQYLKSRKISLQTFSSPFSKDSVKNLIIIFDIPETRKAEREWFRSQLRKFGYEMIQKSVWFGPSPLPENFIDYIESIGLQDSVKMFQASPSAL